MFSLVSNEWFLLPKPTFTSSLYECSRFSLISSAPKLRTPFFSDAMGAFYMSLRLAKNLQLVKEAMKPLPVATRFTPLTASSECMATVIPLASRTTNTRWDFPSRICVQESGLMRGYLKTSLIDAILLGLHV